METLLSVRAELDAIDDALHDLLMRRAAAVARLADSRAKAGTPVLRPGREAAILRRLLERHRGSMPRAVLVRIWREVLASSIRQQGRFCLALHAPDATAARLASEHFGLLTEWRGLATPEAALAAVAAGECQAAVLPLGSGHGGWLAGLERARLGIVARLPLFQPEPGTPAALVVAPGVPDASGDDRSLLLTEPLPEHAAEALARVLAATGLAPRVLLRRPEPGGTRLLLEAEGLLAPDDPRLAPPEFPRVRLLGGYATPITGHPP